MKHPIEKCNIEQEVFLASCPESERRFHQLFFMVGNATYIYHQRAKDFNPTISDWNEWLESLDEPIRSAMKREGFEKCRSVLNFTRFVMERNDVGLDEFLIEKLGKEVVEEYKALSNSV